MDGYYLQTHRITCVNRISGVKIKSEAKTDKCEWKTEKQESSVYPASKQLLNPSHFFSIPLFLLSSLLVLPVCSPFPLFILSISLKHLFNFDGMAFQYLCTNYSLSLVSFDCSVFRFASPLLRFYLLDFEIDMICFSFIFPDVYTYHSHDCMQAS